MSATAKTRLPLLIGAIAVATIAACGTPTTPTAPLELARAKPASQDSTECGTRGWIIINGVLVCNPE